MLGSETQAAADQLADRSIIRAEAVAAWVALALEQTDPDDWVSTLTAAALKRLDTVPEELDVKAEARLQLLDMRRAIRAGIANTHRQLRLPRSAANA